MRIERKSRPRADEPPLLEVQVHSGDIRRGVRYLFVSRRFATIAALVATGYLALTATALVLAPGVVRDLRSAREYEVLSARRYQHGERIRSLLTRLEELGGDSEDLRVRMSKVFLAYGLTTGESAGQGGFPFVPAPVPDSIYAESVRRGNALQARIAEQLGVLQTFLDEVQSFENAHADQIRSTPSRSPMRGSDFVLTSPFGTRRSPFTKAIDFHAGIDLAAPIGTPIYAPADGLVVYAGRYPLRQSVSWWRYGNLVALRHGDRFVTLYGHCEDIRVRSGQRVSQGDVIATVGNTGWSTSPHLHYEIRRREEDGEEHPADPRIYILDHRWRDEDRLLVQARSAPEANDFEPLPRIIARR